MIKVFYMSNDNTEHNIEYPEHMYDNLEKILSFLLNTGKIKEYKIERS